MSGIYIPGMELPQRDEVITIYPDGTAHRHHLGLRLHISESKALPVPDHGRLIDGDALRQAMYHEAFELDSPMQKWDSGCWIRYKMFERMEEDAPTIIPADKEGET